MASPRQPRRPAPAPQAPPPPPQPPARPRAWRRLGLRSLMACLVVGCLTVIAGWHSAGLVRRGEIDRMLRMSAGAPRPAEAEPKTRGKLDRNRLNALVATAGK